MRRITTIGAGARSHDAVHRIVDVVLTLLPTMERLGLGAPGEFDPDALAQRVIDA
jgi:hypothetical protein